MTHADLSPIRRSSVTLREATRLKLKTGRIILSERGIRFSEQRLMRECLRFALRFWRGRKEIARRQKRYNRRLGPYVIVPFYGSEALRSVSCARCHHAGISLSRLVDFAVSQYLPRVLDYWLRFDYDWREETDVAIWKERYALRRHTKDFVISYAARTEKNDGAVLKYTEKSEILPWPPDLSITS